MGTDIHLNAEYKKGGRWHRAEVMVPNHWYMPDHPHSYFRDQPPFVKMVEHCGPRNYDAFAILAGVRNGVGFAGVVLGSGFNPISEPRGLPDDLSDKLRKKHDRRGWDHSISYLTLRELLTGGDDEGLVGDRYWDQRTTHQGLVGVEEYKVWHENGRENGAGPNSWSGDAWGSTIVKVPNAEMDIICGIASPPEGTIVHYEPGVTYESFVRWGGSYRDAAGWYYTDLIPALQQYAADYDLAEDELRLVFWFDS